jgi:SAM-dependent methyltransferase
MELEYKGYERNRTSEKSSFLLSANATVQNFIDKAEPKTEINVLDVGCGTEARFLKDLYEDPRVCKLCSEKNVKLNLFGISADSEPKPPNIVFYKQFLSATKGLECLPENIQFDYILSSWCINYLGPNAFKKLLCDSLERLKKGGIIEFTPYNPSACSCAFSRALDFGEISLRILPTLFFEDMQTKDNINKVKSYIRGYMKIFKLNKTPDQKKDYEYLKYTNVPSEIYEIFIKHFYSSNDISQVGYDTAFDYGIKRFLEKEKIVKETLNMGDEYTFSVYSCSDSDVLCVKREY